MLAFFTPQWGSRVDQDVGPCAGSTTSPLPGKLDVAAENAISVPSFGAQLPPLWRPHLLSLRELSVAAVFVFRFTLGPGECTGTT